jgi:putative transposase
MSKIGATARGIVTVKPRKESKRARGKGRATAVAAKVRAADRELLAIPKTEWAHAKAQERIVKLALRDGIEVAAREASRSTRTIRRMIARYQLSPTLLTFLPRKLGPAPGSRRFDSEREALIAQAVERWMGSREPLPLERAVEDVRQLFRTAGLQSVSRNSVLRRIIDQGGKPLAKAPTDGQRAEIPRTRRALGIVQADHTPVDLIVVDDANRLPIGRPWITIIFDVASRAVLGFHVTLEAPSATSVALSLSMACLSKGKWLQEIGVDVDWPMYGIPDVLHLDNASEFHSEALRRGCERYGISLEYRPPGQTHTGGHIERYLGTLMRRIHGLPGTTMSNVKQRGSYPSEKRASLTLRELEAWLTLEIAGRYHHAIHRGIHMSPSAAWKKALGRRPIPGPQHPEQFVLDFLPAVSRQIGRGGFQLFHIRYWDPLLTRLFQASQRLFVRYDPRNLAQVWVPIPGRGEYLAIHYADLRRPPISRYEQEAAMREIKSSGRRTANEDAIFSTIELQRKLIEGARSNTRTRRVQARRPANRTATVDALPHSDSTIDYSKPAVPYPSETWSS